MGPSTKRADQTDSPMIWESIDIGEDIGNKRKTRPWQERWHKRSSIKLAEGPEFVAEWFEKSFHRKPEHDTAYFNDWVRRFNNGTALDRMDSERREVYYSMKNPEKYQEKKEKVRKWEERWHRRASMTKHAYLSPEEIQASLQRKFGDTPIYDFTEDGTFKTDEYEYSWIIDEDTAYDLAVAYVRESLEDSPESFTSSWIEGHIDEDAWLNDLRSDLENMVSESPESYTTFIDDKEPSGEDGEYSEDQISRMQDGYVEDIAKQGVLEYMKNDLGVQGEDLAKQMMSYIDWDEATKDAVDIDGWAHFLSSYDGEYDTTDEGVVFFIGNKNYGKTHEQEKKEKEERERKTREWQERWHRRGSLKIAGEEVAVSDTPMPAKDAYAQVEELIAQKQYYEAMDLILGNNLTARFDIKDIASKLRYAQLLNFIERYNLNIKDLITPDVINILIEDIKRAGEVFKIFRDEEKNFFETHEYKNVAQAAKLLDFDFIGYLKEQYPEEFFEYPSIEQVKTTEDVSKLRQKKVTDTNHREFPYKIVPMKKTPAGTESHANFTFSFAINSTDDIFPAEIFKTLNKHHASGDKPVAFVFGTYTPGGVLYVDEMQSDIIQRAQMYMQSPEEARKKFTTRIDELEKQYEGKEMPQEIQDRIDKDEKNLKRIETWLSDFMPQYAQYRSKIQNYFSGWNIIALNTVLNFARENKIPNVFVASADMLEKKWLSSGYGAGEFTKDLYERMYDDMVQSRYGAVREGDWWEIDVQGVSDKIAIKNRMLIKQAEYEELYKLYQPRIDESVKGKLLEIPAIKQFVDENITADDWNNLTIGFWNHIPFYDEVKQSIYFPDSFYHKIMHDKEDMPSSEEYTDEMTKHWQEEAKYWAEQAKQWGEESKIEPEDYVDEYTEMLFSNEIDEYEIRMILHELSHYADHLERGEQFVEETTSYFTDPEKKNIDIEKYKQSPAEQKSFLAEIKYLKNQGQNDTDIIFKMIMQYGGTDDFWKPLVELVIKTAESDIMEINPTCNIFSNEYNKFTEEWCKKLYDYLKNEFGGFAERLSGKIRKLSEVDSIQLDATSLYDSYTGDIFLKDNEMNVGYIISALLHEMIHANLGSIYDDIQLEEGCTDYLCELISRNDMFEKCNHEINIACIEANERTKKKSEDNPNEYNISRYKGLEYARKIGDDIINILKNLKRSKKKLSVRMEKMSYDGSIDVAYILSKKIVQWIRDNLVYLFEKAHFNKDEIDIALKELKVEVSSDFLGIATIPPLKEIRIGYDMFDMISSKTMSVDNILENFISEYESVLAHEVGHYIDYLIQEDEALEMKYYTTDKDDKSLGLGHEQFMEWLSSPDEYIAFINEIRYWRQKGLSDNKIIEKMRNIMNAKNIPKAFFQYLMEYAHRLLMLEKQAQKPNYMNKVKKWQERWTRRKASMNKKAVWSVWDNQTDQWLYTSRNVETLQEAVNDMVDYLVSSNDFEDELLEDLRHMSLDDKKDWVEGFEFEFKEEFAPIEDEATAEEIRKLEDKKKKEKERIREWQERWHKRSSLKAIA